MASLAVLGGISVHYLSGSLEVSDGIPPPIGSLWEVKLKLLNRNNLQLPFS
jgi:hypothetical protein